MRCSLKNRWLILITALVLTGALVWYVSQRFSLRRVGDNGVASWGTYEGFVRWRIPDDHPINDLIWKKDGYLYTGPCETEIIDIHGTEYRKAEKTLCLATDDSGSRHVLMTYSHNPLPGSRGRADGYEQDYLTGQVEGKPPTSSDGRMFDWSKDSPMQIKVTVADKYYFLWKRQ